MRVSNSNTRCLLAIVIMAVWLGTIAAWAQSQTDKIQLPGSSTPIIVSNLSGNVDPGLERLNPSAGTFKQVQEDLFKPLANSMKSVDSMQGIMELPLPQSRPQMSRHTRELMDQRRNWAFTDLKDLYPEASAEEMLGIKQTGGLGEDKVSASLIERYYENLGQKNPESKNKTGQELDLSGTKQFSVSNNLHILSHSFPGSDQFTKILFSGGPEAFTSDRSGPGSEEISVADALEIKAEKKRFADFRQMLDANPQVAGFPGGLNPAGADDVARRAAITDPYRSSISPMLGMIDPTKTALHTHADDDPTAFRLGLPNPAKWTPPAKPHETMQQMLDPFAAGRSKPKF